MYNFNVFYFMNTKTKRKNGFLKEMVKCVEKINFKHVFRLYICVNVNHVCIAVKLEFSI